MNGPTYFINRIKISKGSTIKRTKGIPKNASCKIIKEESEENRKKDSK